MSYIFTAYNNNTENICSNVNSQNNISDINVLEFPVISSSFLCKKHTSSHDTFFSSPQKEMFSHSSKSKFVPKSSSYMYKDIILTSKECYDKTIADERNQGINSPMKSGIWDNMIWSDSNVNCNVKRNLVNYFNNRGNCEFKQMTIYDYFKK